MPGIDRPHAPAGATLLQLGRTAWLVLLVLLGLLACLPRAWAQAAPPLFDAPPRSGTVALELRPTEVVSAGQTRLVTFGVPFPRGALLPSELGQVRLHVNGAEVPIWVDVLTPWRHLSDPAQDGSSVRVLRVQLQHTFGSPVAPVPAMLSWNQAPRSLSRTALVEPRSAWHRVTDGTTASGGRTFGAGHNVFEPDVYALLPKAWLAVSGLKHPVKPFADSVVETRRNPSTMAPRYPGYEEADHAQVNFFYTILNDDEPNSAPVVGNNTNDFTEPGAYEPWLYDRAMVMFVGYLRGGQFRMLREAVRNADYYRQQLWTPADCDSEPFRHACSGSFKLKNADPRASWHDAKYSYNESLAFAHWLTGDSAPLPHIEHVTRQYTDSAAVNSVFWTERHMGLKLLAEVVAWELTGKPEYRSRLQQTLAAFRQGQTAPFGGLADGGIWHASRAHEGDDSDEPITSPWMSALLVDAALRGIVSGEATHAQAVVEGLAAHVCGRGSYRSAEALRAQSGGATLRVPHYLATRDGVGLDIDPFATVEHAHDVAGIAAWGAYFRARSGDRAASAALAGCAGELYTTFDHVITNWTRPGTANYDAYRVNPPRKYTWWFKNSSGFGWAMAAAGGAPPPAASVALTSPASGAQYTAPASFTLVAVPSSAPALARVEFWRNGVRIGDDASAPYSLALSGLAAGSYRFEARAVPVSGAVLVSPPVDVVVLQGSTPPPPPPPEVTVSLGSPAPGSSFVQGTAVPLAATVGGAGALARVEFRVGGQLVLADAQAPYGGTWTAGAPGTWSVQARAVLVDGRLVDSAAATFTVTAAPPVGSVVQLRQGVDGYAGAIDLGVSSQYLPYNGGRGVVSNDARSGAYRISGTSGYEVRSFLRFGGLEAFRGRRLLKAELVLHFVWGASGYTLAGQFLAVPWNPASPAFGWSRRGDGLNWALPGSGGSDWVPGKGFTISGFSAASADRRSAVLDTAAVQSWIDDPATNHGLVLLATSADKVSWLRTAEDAAPGWRPALVLTFD